MIIDVIPAAPEQWRLQPHRAAVLGSPIDHSLSPVLHNAAYHALELPWTYSRREVVVPDLADVLEDATSLDVGFSVTMPLKTEALRLSDAHTTTAELVGGANTLVHRDGQWLADNTDVHGVVMAVSSVLEPTDSIETLAILGAGATARAVVLAARTLEVGSLLMCSRRQEPADELIALAQSEGLAASYVAWQDAPGALTSDVVVSTVVAGANDHLAEAVPVRPRVLLDAVYAPWPRPLGEAWTRAGGELVPGTRMLLHQAAEQVRLMTGLNAPIHNMRAALESVGAPV